MRQCGVGRLVRAVLVILAALAPFVVAGCGGDGDSMSQDEFEASLVQREQLTPETAGCVSSYLYETLPDKERVLLAEGSEELSAQVWGRYVPVLMACQFHDELGITTSTDEGG